MGRLDYYRRLAAAYVLGRRSHLTFWHDRPEANEAAPVDSLGPYYMTFAAKAGYAGPFDASGVPLLDYRGAIGRQYNPIATAQYGLARHSRFCATRDAADREAFLCQADWLAANLEPNGHGVPVWHHHFDWNYVQRLKAPWYSGLAQGQGISLLVRAHAETGDSRYMDAALAAFRTFTLDVREGGVICRDGDSGMWIEEYIVDPPTHILNGFIWALWGIRDLTLAGTETRAEELWESCVATLARNLHRFDTGFWSLYDLSRPVGLRMISSRFYHGLHVVQLRIMFRLTGQETFREYADTWEGYGQRWLNRQRSLVHKAAFKLLHY